VLPLTRAEQSRVSRGFFNERVFQERAMRQGPLISAAALSGFLVFAPALQAQQSQQEQTKPPLGTASFEPPTAMEEAPLTAETFVVRAAIANMAEIDLGKLALSRSADPGVQAYARKMIDEHGRAQKELEHAAAQAKIALPATVDEKHRKLQQELAALGGEDFDRQYAKVMAAGHDDAVALFDAAAHSKSLPPVLQTFASRTLPVVRQHRDAAQRLYSSKAG
jgi:putative membrane protein